MKKILATIMAIISVACLLCACSPKVGENEVMFDTVVNDDFGGLGVEWGVYEDTSKLVSDAKERTHAALKRLRPAMVRCMTNFDWLVYDYDGKNTDDVSDDEWKYNFTNKYMQSCYEVLDYCRENDIAVAFGVWNVVGSGSGYEYVQGTDGKTVRAESNSVDWNMYENVTSDPRWARLTADLLDYLVNKCGYDCIKWYVSSNEPNYAGGKNAKNTYEKWQQGVLNVRAALDEVGLESIDIVGGDTTGFWGSAEYLPQIAKNLSNKVNNYGVHMYVSNYDIDNAVYMQNLAKLYDGVKAVDDELGKTKPFIIWEAGLLDGKNTETDCNAYIVNYSYGMRMADFTVQSLLSGADGVVYWDLDDAMHFMYSDGGTTAKEWGMFSTLSGAPSSMQELRPWFHSSVLLTNLLRPQNKILSATVAEQNASFRAIATVSADGKHGGFVAINRDKQAVTKTFYWNKDYEFSGDKLYVYVYSEKQLRLGEDGFVVPNRVIYATLSDRLTIEIPAGSMVVVSDREL